jgi:hypothetical protein
LRKGWKNDRELCVAGAAFSLVDALLDADECDVPETCELELLEFGLLAELPTEDELKPPPE